MGAPGGRRVRLSIDVEPELRQAIKIAAAARDLSVRDYVEAVLRRALEVEAQGEDPAARAGWSKPTPHGGARKQELGEDWGADRVLTHAEQERGLRALEELDRLDRELLERRRGKPFAPARELLDEARDERTRSLTGDA